MQPNEKENIFTDDINYAATSDDSVWGTEDPATLELVQKTDIRGTWLDLCAGDGRFVRKLLQKVDHLVAIDIDEGALQKIFRITPDDLKPKLSTQVANVVKSLPFEDATFDGIFCVGTLHLFPKEVFKNIFQELNRILKPGGRMIIDFATDIRRTYADGSLWIVENEPNYTLEEALSFLKGVFQDYTISIHTDSVEPEKVTLDDKEYLFTSNFILIDAVKK